MGVDVLPQLLIQAQFCRQPGVCLENAVKEPSARDLPRPTHVQAVGHKKLLNLLKLDE